MDLVKFAKESILIQKKGLDLMATHLDESFVRAVRILSMQKGRLVLCGLGKSGLVAKKISATLASTGTPSFFMHPADALHGDLGMLQRGDAVMAISYSGESEELLQIASILRSRGHLFLSMTGNPASTLAKNSDHHFNVKISKEACPYELAPTSSATATMVMGDAIALCLMKLKKFTPQSFAENHPSGALGKKLLTKVSQLMRKDNLPTLSPDDEVFPHLVQVLSKGRLGLVIVQKKNKIVGIVTDGDFRRAIEKASKKVMDLKVSDIMTKNPKLIHPSATLHEAENMMNENKIISLIVAEEKKLKGVIQIYDLTK